MNFVNELTNAFRSVVISKYPQILIECAKPSMHRIAISSSVVSSRILENVTSFGYHVFSNSGLIALQSSTVTKALFPDY